MSIRKRIAEGRACGPFGGFARAGARGPAVRHDHGPLYMSDQFLKELVIPETNDGTWLIEQRGLVSSTGCRQRSLKRPATAG
jgi:hypothetical protein